LLEAQYKLSLFSGLDRGYSFIWRIIEIMEIANKVINKWRCWRNPSLLLCAMLGFFFSRKKSEDKVVVLGCFMKAMSLLSHLYYSNILLLKRFFLSSEIQG
jgi:hypothetical protein